MSEENIEMTAQSSIVSPPDEFCFSLDTSKLMAALAKAQADFPIIKKSGVVDYTFSGKRTNYTYAELSEFVSAIRKPLADNNLSIMHDCRIVPAGCSASTMLVHGSGQWVKSAPIVIKQTDSKAQGYGSALSYARRYSLTSFLSLCANDEDTDCSEQYQDNVPFGSTEHLTMTAELMNTHGIHKDKRKKLIEWLIDSNHSSAYLDLEKTIKMTADKIKSKE